MADAVLAGCGSDGCQMCEDGFGRVRWCLESAHGCASDSREGVPNVLLC